MQRYQHTQKATLILAAMAIVTAALTVMGLAIFPPLLVAVPFLILVGWLFHSLTIEVADGRLRWRFGPALIRKDVPLDQIASVKPVRTNVLEGWGIHYSRFGWLYNVSGFEAVAITLKNGKRFCLGTDEPAKLLESLSQQAP